MRTIMAKTPHDSSFSFSRRYIHWPTKKIDTAEAEAKEGENDDVVLNSSPPNAEDEQKTFKKKKKISAVYRLLSLLRGKSHHRRRQLGTRVVGTLFGHRRGHVHFAFQEDPSRKPAVLVELAMPTSALVREMASGLVRIALECDRDHSALALMEEPVWRTYCNGRKCGAASRAECGPDEWNVLRAVGPITMGAGVLPSSGEECGHGEIMYMRASFERVVGSADSEAFYMMNPDAASGGPELSIYLLRV